MRVDFFLAGMVLSVYAPVTVAPPREQGLGAGSFLLLGSG